MSIAYQSPHLMPPTRSVYIATACYESVKGGFAKSLAETTAALTRHGIPFGFNILYGNCHVDDGRNNLVQEFLTKTQFSDLVFVDADVMWSAETFLDLLRHNVTDIVAGVYPFKSDEGDFPVGRIIDGIKGDATGERGGLLSVSYAPTGFMRIPRTVFQKMAPGDYAKGKLNPNSRFFQRRYTETSYDGGDVTFCRRWIACGGKVLVDPTLKLAHIGEKLWTGQLLDFLKQPENLEKHTTSASDPMPVYKPDARPVWAAVKGSPTGAPPRDRNEAPEVWAAIDGLRTADADAAHFRTLADAYGNKPWAATAEYLETAYRMAMELEDGASVLECGSGLTTVVLACAAELKRHHFTALEHDPEWRGVTMQWLRAFDLETPGILTGAVFDKAKGWYEATPEKTPDLIVIDGPPHHMGADRIYPLRQPWAARSIVLLDDAIPETLAGLKRIQGYWEPVDLGGRLAAVGRVGMTAADMPLAAE